jgi:hypothetical protein
LLQNLQSRLHPVQPLRLAPEQVTKQGPVLLRLAPPSGTILPRRPVRAQGPAPVPLPRGEQPQEAPAFLWWACQEPVHLLAWGRLVPARVTGPDQWSVGSVRGQARARGPDFDQPGVLPRAAV